MPELPEVETVCRTLHERLQGVRILEVRVIEGPLAAARGRGFRCPARGQDRGRGDPARQVHRAELDGGWTWVSHLGMSGKLTFRERDASMEKHDHLVFTLDDGGDLRYHDPRRFGLCVVLPDVELNAWPPFAKLGLDPLDHRFTCDYLYPFLHRSRRSIRDLLLDQQIVAGSATSTSTRCFFAPGFVPPAGGTAYRER